MKTSAQQTLQRWEASVRHREQDAKCKMPCVKGIAERAVTGEEVKKGERKDV